MEQRWMDQINQPAVCCRDFFIQRAVELLNYYDKIKQLRGEDDPFCVMILKTAQLNKDLADVFR